MTTQPVGNWGAGVIVRQLYARLQALWRWNRKESELDDEIRFHLGEEADAQVAAGFSESDARIRATRDFGNVALIRETTREVWGWGSAERLAQDLRFGYRSLKGTPIVSAVAILSLPSASAPIRPSFPFSTHSFSALSP
jgi:hypothetical protein